MRFDSCFVISLLSTMSFRPGPVRRTYRSISGLCGGETTSYTDTHIQWRILTYSHRSSMLAIEDLDRIKLGHESVH